MTHAEEILQTVARLVKQEGFDEFTRQDVRKKADVSPEDWVRSYSPVFQGMREDHLRAEHRWADSKMYSGE